MAELSAGGSLGPMDPTHALGRGKTYHLTLAGPKW